MVDKDDVTDNETYTVVLRMAAKLLANQAACSYAASNPQGIAWLVAASNANILASQYEKKKA